MKVKDFFQKINQKRKEKKQKIEPETFGEMLFSLFKTLGVALLFVICVQGLLLASFIVPTGSMENTVMTGDFLIAIKKFGPSTPQVIPFFNISLPYTLLPTPFDPKRGEVIVFIYPGGRDALKAEDFQYYLKRCVAEPGDTLQIIENKLYVNGEYQPLPQKGIIETNGREDPTEIFRTFPASKKHTVSNYGPIRVPKKGDTIHFDTRADFDDFRIFIMREGHQAEWLGNKALIDNDATNFYIVKQDYYFGMGDNRHNSSDSREWGFIPRKAILGSPIICWLSWEMYDEAGNERNIFGKFANIRWNRIGSIIN